MYQRRPVKSASSLVGQRRSHEATVVELGRRFAWTLLHMLQRLGRPDGPRRVEVQGVELWMPRSHTLPLFARIYPLYGQNLVMLARLLAGQKAGQTLRVIDIGANVGDSARQLSCAVPCHILCVEGDPKWLPFLRRNSAGASWEVEAAFVDVAQARGSRMVHSGGTTQLVPGPAGGPDAAFLSMSDILDRHPDFRSADLVKTDTDGYDGEIIRQMLSDGACADAVIFFEYDPVLTRRAGNDDPAQIWSALGEAGYEAFLLWDNFGNYLGAHASQEVERMSRLLEKDRATRSYDYWDVAALRPRHKFLVHLIEDSAQARRRS